MKHSIIVFLLFLSFSCFSQFNIHSKLDYKGRPKTVVVTKNREDGSFENYKYHYDAKGRIIKALYESMNEGVKVLSSISLFYDLDEVTALLYFGGDLVGRYRLNNGRLIEWQDRLFYRKIGEEHNSNPFFPTTKENSINTYYHADLDLFGNVTSDVTKGVDMNYVGLYIREFNYDSENRPVEVKIYDAKCENCSNSIESYKVSKESNVPVKISSIEYDALGRTLNYKYGYDQEKGVDIIVKEYKISYRPNNRGRRDVVVSEKYEFESKLGLFNTKRILSMSKFVKVDKHEGNKPYNFQSKSIFNYSNGVITAWKDSIEVLPNETFLPGMYKPFGRAFQNDDIHYINRSINPRNVKYYIRYTNTKEGSEVTKMNWYNGNNFKKSPKNGMSDIRFVNQMLSRIHRTHISFSDIDWLDLDELMTPRKYAFSINRTGFSNYKVRKSNNYSKYKFVFKDGSKNVFENCSSNCGKLIVLKEDDYENWTEMNEVDSSGKVKIKFKRIIQYHYDEILDNRERPKELKGDFTNIIRNN